METVKVGQELPLYPQTISFCDDGSKGKVSMVGMVTYIPRHRRFFVASFKFRSGIIRECFKFPLLPLDTPLLKEK